MSLGHSALAEPRDIRLNPRLIHAKLMRLDLRVVRPSTEAINRHGKLRNLRLQYLNIAFPLKCA